MFAPVIWHIPALVCPDPPEKVPFEIQAPLEKAPQVTKGFLRAVNIKSPRRTGGLKMSLYPESL